MRAQLLNMILFFQLTSMGNIIVLSNSDKNVVLAGHERKVI